MNQMDKINFVLYVNLMNKYEEQAKEGTTMIFSSDEKNLMKYMKEIAKKDSVTRKFLNELTDMSPHERELAVEKLFGDEKSSHDLVTIEEIKDYKEQIDELSKEDKNKLNYIINNYRKFRVKGIYLDTLKFIDEDDVEHEVIFDKRLDQYTVKGLKIEEVEEIPEKEDYEPLRSRRYSKEELMEEEPEEKEIKKEPKKKSKKGLIGAILLFLFTAFAGGLIATIISIFLSK